MGDTEHFNWDSLSKFYPSSPHRQSPHRMVGSPLSKPMKRPANESRSPTAKRIHRPVISVLDDDPFIDSMDQQQEASNITMEDHVARAKSRLLARITEKSTPTRLYGLEDQYIKLHELLDQTVAKGESNSCLIIGNRGTGKSMLVRRALEDLEKEYNRSGESNFMVIRLNGQTESTDRIALNEIARQLFAKQKQQGLQQQQEHGRQFVSAVYIEKEDFTRFNPFIRIHTHNSTVVWLFEGQASFAESFEYLLSLLKAGDKSTLPIVFVLDEFDLFAQQSKQALLYNLFDAAQSAQNPMAVIGLTCRLDALSLLEKRVKSRFSHRQIYVFPPATFGEFIELARSQLRLEIVLGDPATYNAYVEKFNTALEDLFQDPTMNSILRRIFDLTKDIRAFYKLCFEPLSQLTEQEPFLRVDYFQEASIAQRSDAKTEILKGVSLLELILIVSIKKLLEKEITTFNFAMVYDEYKDFMNQTQIRGGFGMKLYKRPVALKAFENLQGFELVCPVEDIAKCPKEYRMARLMLEQTQVTEAVLKYKDCPAPIKRWATT